MSDEKVLCAAIWFNDGQHYYHQPTNIPSGFVISGWRHGSILMVAKAMNCKISPNDQVQGFITSKNRFLNRKEAREFVLSTGQLQTTEFGDELYSEDLY